MRWLRQDEGFTSLKANGFPAPALWAKKKRGKKERDLNNFFLFYRDNFPWDKRVGFWWGGGGLVTAVFPYPGLKLFGF